MKTTKITLILILLFTVGNITDVSAQTWLERLGQRAERSAKQKVERKVDKAVDNAFDKSAEKAKQKKEKNVDNRVMKLPADNGAPARDPRDWDDGEPYHALKKGTRIVYTFYDGKGRVQGYNRQEIIEMKRTKNSVYAVVSGRQTDSKGKFENSATVAMNYRNGNFYVDLLSIMLPKDMKGIDADVKGSGRDMLIPGKLTPGQELPEAHATFKMKVKSGEGTFDMPPVTFRVFNRRAIQAESVETPMGNFICFKIIQTGEVHYPLIGKQLFTSITWIGKGLGSIKTETYDNKGKLQSRMLLTELR
ncbi:hypothetical protein [Bacteroides pyogenes]|uniref:TapB family protein n=1 Tax=Bacteroides pyogenes TaxID=310300 RepID=UPI001BACF594|nr:hypothetical protein [Bacteroides pyogenes]MBR8706585.1 hypothetical protein [Bacteroides pyogenes]